MNSNENIEYLTQEMILQSKKRRLSDEKGKKKIRDKTWYSRRILQFDVDPFDYPDSLLVELGIEMFRYYDILSIFSIDENSLRNFLNAVRRLYKPDNYFHNFNHVWTVMHATFRVLYVGADQYLETLDIFAALVSAVCHDIGHPGNNNDFELATRSKVSEVYALPAGKNVLECLHATLTQTLLVSTDCDILCGLTPGEKAQFKDIVSGVILGTDMALHAEIEASLQKIVESAVHARDEYISIHGPATRLRQKKREQQHDDDNDRDVVEKTSRRSRVAVNSSNSLHRATDGKTISSQIVGKQSAGDNTLDDNKKQMSEMTRRSFLRAIVHSADIGAQTQIYPIAKKWMERMYSEFNSQAEKETAMGIRTSTFIHNCSIDVKKYESQVFFIETFVEPVWRSLSVMLPLLNEDYRQLLSNKSVYKRQLLKMTDGDSDLKI
jgi:hypothetical protein